MKQLTMSTSVVKASPERYKLKVSCTDKLTVLERNVKPLPLIDS